MVKRRALIPGSVHNISASEYPLVKVLLRWHAGIGHCITSAIVLQPIEENELQHRCAYTARMISKTILTLSVAVLTIPLLLFAQTQTAPVTPVVQLQNLAHAVDSLDKTEAGNVFVRDVNGFMWELIQRVPARGR